MTPPVVRNGNSELMKVVVAASITMNSGIVLGALTLGPELGVMREHIHNPDTHPITAVIEARLTRIEQDIAEIKQMLRDG